MWYTVKTKPVKIMKKSTDVTGIPISSISVLENLLGNLFWKSLKYERLNI